MHTLVFSCIALVCDNVTAAAATTVISPSWRKAPGNASVDSTSASNTKHEEMMIPQKHSSRISTATSATTTTTAATATSAKGSKSNKKLQHHNRQHSTGSMKEPKSKRRGASHNTRQMVVSVI